MKSKIYRFISAAGVAIAAFFELCFTARADRAWRLARTDSRRISLSSRSAGAKVTPAEHPQPRPGTLLSRRRVGVQLPPAPALQLSRKVNIGMYSAMPIFLVFCITAIVMCPDGRINLTEDGNSSLRIAGQSASGTATEGPSSAPVGVKRLAIAGCVIALIMIIGVIYINASRKESNYGKEGKENRG